jgi:hypothetical protein
MTRSRRLLAVVLPLLGLSAAGCDSVNGDTYGNVVDVVSFTVRTADGITSGDGLTTTFASDDIQDATARNLIEEILDQPEVTSDGVVLVYAEDDLFIGTASGSITRWAALPYTEGFENIDVNGVPYVDLTLTYTYSFDAGAAGTADDGNLYFDIVSSAANVDIETFLNDRLDSDRFRLKLVAIPRELFEGSGLTTTDLGDYQTVARTFDIAAE